MAFGKPETAGNSRAGGHPCLVPGNGVAGVSNWPTPRERILLTTFALCATIHPLLARMLINTATHIPGARGTYVLVAFLSRRQRLEIGRLGVCNMPPGYYAYVGSALGPGGLQARLRHHLGVHPRPHWHLDYLLAHARPVEVWCALSARKLERAMAAALGRFPDLRMPVPGFGSSDYRRDGTSHLFHSRCRPSFDRFKQEIGPVRAEFQRLLLDQT